MTEELNVIERLYASFEELETAIASAKSTLREKERKNAGSVPSNVMERISSYETMLLKQRQLANDLEFYIDQGEWDEVHRNVGLINGLSRMIRDDARDVLGDLGVVTE